MIFNFTKKKLGKNSKNSSNKKQTLKNRLKKKLGLHNNSKKNSKVLLLEQKIAHKKSQIEKNKNRLNKQFKEYRVSKYLDRLNMTKLRVNKLKKELKNKNEQIREIKNDIETIKTSKIKSPKIVLPKSVIVKSPTPVIKTPSPSGIKPPTPPPLPTKKKSPVTKKKSPVTKKKSPVTKKKSPVTKGKDITKEVLKGRNKNHQTACIIYTVEKSTKDIYFVVSRKIPLEARINKSGKNIGAAGTKDIYHGKWTSLGGGKNKKITEIKGALYEINEESGLSIYSKIGLGKGPKPKLLSLGKSTKDEKLELKKALELGKTTLFIFNFDENNNKLFFELFPKFSDGGRQSTIIVSSSSGECDVIASMTIDNIKTEQENSVSKKKNNFFTSYFLKSFQNTVIPEICNLDTEFKNKYNTTTFNVLDDKEGRKIDDLTENKIIKKYKEDKKIKGKITYKLV